MRSMLQAGLAAVMLCSWGGASIAADACLSEQDADALHVASVRQQLEVASESCGRDVASYGRFVERYQADVKNSDATLMDFFSRHSLQTGAADYHTFKAKLAYMSSLRDSREHTNFCRQAGRMLDSLLHGKDSLSKFAEAQPVEFEMPYAACTAQPSPPAPTFEAGLVQSPAQSTNPPALSAQPKSAAKPPKSPETIAPSVTTDLTDPVLIAGLKQSARDTIAQRHSSVGEDLPLLRPRDVALKAPAIAFAAPSISPKMKPYALDREAETAELDVFRRPARSWFRRPQVVEAAIFPTPKPFWLVDPPRRIARTEPDEREHRRHLAELRQSDQGRRIREASASRASHDLLGHDWAGRRTAADDRPAERAARFHDYRRPLASPKLAELPVHESRFTAETRTRMSVRPAAPNTLADDFASLLARLTAPSPSAPSIPVAKAPMQAVAHAEPSTAIAVPAHTAQGPIRAAVQPRATEPSDDSMRTNAARDDRSDEFNLAQNDTYDSQSADDEDGYARYRPRQRRHWYARRQYFNPGGWDSYEGERYGAYAARSDEDDGSSDYGYDYGRGSWQ
jgi:hypothetical protein